MDQERSLLILDHGFLSVRLGDGPDVIVGAGAALNCASLLRLNRRGGGSSSKESVPEEPARPSYEQTLELASQPPALFDGRLPDEQLRYTPQNLSGDALCFYTLCPQAAKEAESMRHLQDTKPLPVQIHAAANLPSGDVAEGGTNGDDAKVVGCQVTAITMQIVRLAAFSPSASWEEAQLLRQGFETYELNRQRLVSLWHSLSGVCGALFAGMPTDVLWGVVESSERVLAEPGEEILAEGSSGEDICVIEEGQASVEKAASRSLKESAAKTIGKLGPGTIMGDLLFLGSQVPRAASVRALTRVNAVRISSSRLLEVFRRFPGALTTIQRRLDLWARFLKTRTPVSDDGFAKKQDGRDNLGSSGFFALCSPNFLAEVNRAAKWCTFYCGELVKVPDKDLDKDEEAGEHVGTLLVLIFGRCSWAKSSVPGVNAKELDTGDCFQAIQAEQLNVRVLTPVVVLLMLRRADLHTAIARYPEESKRFRRENFTMDSGGLASALTQANVFKQCGRAFVEAISTAIDVKCYMPGQTVCIMGSRDASQMFVLRSGCVVVERFGKKMVVKNAGCTLGELMMLGVVSTRSATIRALTFCSMMEVPRAAFMATVERFPNERARFEHLAMQNMEMQTIWPFLQDVPSRMHLWLNMHAAFKVLPPGDTSLSQPPSVGSAVLVVNGTAAVVDPDGEETATLSTGDSFNEHALLGLPNLTGAHVVPRTNCQFQIVTEEVWKTFLSEFASDQEDNRNRVLRHLSERAMRRFKQECGGTSAMLRRSGLFRKAPDALVEPLGQCLKHRAYVPRAVIAERRKATSLFILLEGVVVEEPLPEGDLRGPRELQPGSVFGEAALVDANRGGLHTYRAAGHDVCLVLELCQADLKRRLQDQERITDRMYFNTLQSHSPEDLGVRLPHTTALRGCTKQFLQLACQDAEDVFYASGDIIIARGESCCLGVTPFFVMLSGQAVVEGELGVSLGYIGMGEVFGEAGAMGLSVSRTATVRAVGPGIVHCAKLHGQYIAEALNKGSASEECSLGDVFAKRQALNISTQVSRSKVLEESVLPAMRMSTLFADWPHGLLEALAAPLSDHRVQPGELISTAGEEADSMLVVLKGAVQVETFGGVRLGMLKEGASIGEVAALGLFDTRLATLRGGPSTGCTVLKLPAHVLRSALTAPGAEVVRQKADRVMACRQKQVARGLPISALPLGVPADDVAVRAVALQAERLDLAPGEVLQPLPDDGPCGPHYGVLVRGRANVEVVHDSRTVMQLTPGSLFIEGQAADYGAQLRATTACEAYRVREIDLSSAVRSAKGAQDWYPRFRVLEKKVRAEGTHRLKNALGCSQGLAPHPIDRDIMSWKAHRVERLEHARHQRQLEAKRPSSRETLPRVDSAPSLCCTPGSGCQVARASTPSSAWLGPLFAPTQPADELLDRPPSAASLSASAAGADVGRAISRLFTDPGMDTPDSSKVLSCSGRRPMGPGMVPLEGLRQQWALPTSNFGDLLLDVTRRSRSGARLRRQRSWAGAGSCW